jgi:glutamyl-tRNA synthetase
MSNVRTRFAPSPTGEIHIGSVYSALLDYAFAKKHGGQVFLRIEDTDRDRYVEGAVNTIISGLEWVGIKFDDEPILQSDRLDIYQKHAEELLSQGKAYYCFCSKERLERIRQKQKQAGQPPMYDRHCRDIPIKEAKKRIADGETAVIRMKIPDDQTIRVNDLIRGEVKFDSNLIDDQVLLKSDGYPTYHLAVVVDDHLMKISHVVRGQEWLPSSPKHILLYQYFDWQIPEILHTPVLLDPEGGKLSKRSGHTSLSWYRDQGFLPEAILNFLGQLGWTHPKEKEIFSMDEFIKVFDLKDVAPVAPVFDIQKLEWMNGVYIRNKSDSELAKLLSDYLPEMTGNQLSQAVPLIKDRIKRLSDAKDMLEFIWIYPEYSPDLLTPKKLNKDEARKMLEGIKEVIKKKGIDKTETLQDDLMALIKDNNWNTGNFFMVFRVAVCAKKVTPPILPSLKLIGRKETLRRIDAAIAKLKIEN